MGNYLKPCNDTIDAIINLINSKTPYKIRKEQFIFHDCSRHDKESGTDFCFIIDGGKELIYLIDNGVVEYTEVEVLTTPRVHVDCEFYDCCYPCQILLSINDQSYWLKKRRESYSDYLKSDKWINFRSRVFAKRGFKCESCSSKKNMQLHHLTYENVGNEHDEDVMILCQQCHEKAHKN